MGIIKKIKQIIADHRAMSEIRNGKGDVQLIACVGIDGFRWDCHIYQHADYSSATDPSTAILLAAKDMRRKGGAQHSVAEN